MGCIYNKWKQCHLQNLPRKLKLNSCHEILNKLKTYGPRMAFADKTFIILQCLNFPMKLIAQWSWQQLIIRIHGVYAFLCPEYFFV